MPGTARPPGACANRPAVREAAAAISRAAKAIGVTVSESSGTVRLFQNGNVVLRVEPFRRPIKWKEFGYEPPETATPEPEDSNDGPELAACGSKPHRLSQSTPDKTLSSKRPALRSGQRRGGAQALGVDVDDEGGEQDEAADQDLEEAVDIDVVDTRIGTDIDNAERAVKTRSASD